MGTEYGLLCFFQITVIIHWEERTHTRHTLVVCRDRTRYCLASFFAVDSPSHSNYRSPCQLNAVSFPVMITLIRQDCPIWRPGWIWKIPNRTGFEGVNRKNNLLGQWLNFKFFGITYSVEKTKCKLLFQGPLAKWDKDVSSEVSQYFSISCFSFIDLHYVLRRTTADVLTCKCNGNLWICC